MKKRITTAVAFAACLALCATVWPQNEPSEEALAPPTSLAVIAAQPEASEKAEIEEIIMTEKEKTDVTQSEPIHELTTEPEPMTTQTPLASKVQAPPEQNATPLQEPEPAPENWSTCRASDGWKAKAPIMSNTPRICTRTATR